MRPRIMFWLELGGGLDTHPLKRGDAEPLLGDRIVTSVPTEDRRLSLPGQASPGKIRPMDMLR